MSADHLARLVREHYENPPREHRSLYVGEFVMGRMGSRWPAPSFKPWTPRGALVDLMAIPVVVDSALGPDVWQLRNADDVVLYEGTLPPAPAEPAAPTHVTESDDVKES